MQQLMRLCAPLLGDKCGPVYAEQTVENFPNTHLNGSTSSPYVRWPYSGSSFFSVMCRCRKKKMKKSGQGV